MIKNIQKLPSLQREIDKIKQDLILLGAMVEQNLHRSILALDNQDLEIANQVIEKDDSIDIKEVELEEECLKILALYQPVAVDLRYIIATLKVNNDLERIGDLAVNIAKSIKYFIEGVNVKPFKELMKSSKIVQQMLKMSLDSFIRLDVDLANSILIEDDKVDDIHRQITKKVISKISFDKVNAEQWMSILTVSRYLERAADHTTNIAEDILYLVEGNIRRHTYK